VKIFATTQWTSSLIRAQEENCYVYSLALLLRWELIFNYKVGLNYIRLLSNFSDTTADKIEIMIIMIRGNWIKLRLTTQVIVQKQRNRAGLTANTKNKHDWCKYEMISWYSRFLSYFMFRKVAKKVKCRICSLKFFIEMPETPNNPKNTYNT